MAKAVGVSVSSVQRIWRAARTSAASSAPVDALQRSGLRRQGARCRRALCRSIGARLVLSVDEKSQIQAFDPTQPGPPKKQGRAGTMTHDYNRNG